MANNDGWEDLDGGWEDINSGPSFIDQATGVGQTAASMISGGAGQLMGGLGALAVAPGVALHSALTGAPDGTTMRELDRVVKGTTDAMTYEPSRQTGKEYNEGAQKWIGEKMEEYAYPSAEKVVAAIPFVGDRMTKEQREALARGAADVGLNFLAIPGAHALTQFKKGAHLKDIKAGAADKLNAKVDEPVIPKAEAGWQDLPHQQEMFPQNPYDVGGHVTAAKEGMPTTLDNPQMEMFGRNEALIPDTPREPGLPPIEQVAEAPRLPDAPVGERPLPMVPTNEVPRIPGTGLEFPNIEGQHQLPFPKLEEPAPRTPLDVGLQEHTFDNGVRTTDSTTGRVVQGGDASIPTVDFPLKTELIDRDPTIQSLRERIASTEADLAEMTAAGRKTEAMEGTLTYLKNEFAKYMDESYGVLEKGDTYPGLIESGSTKLPIKHTHNAGKGKSFNFKSKKQRGAVNLDLITFGLAKHAENFRKWFGDSVVKDADNRPIKVYHGSVKKGLDELDPKASAVRTRTGPDGIYFTDNPSAASNYTSYPRSFGAKNVNKERGEVYSSYLRIENPLDITDTIKAFQKKGMKFSEAKRESLKQLTPEHDGVIFKGDNLNPSEYIVFDANQVKSANRNNGGYGLNSKKMTGAINPKEIREGFAELFKGRGIPEKLADTVAAATKADVASSTNHFDQVQALKSAVGGKGIGDFINWGNTAPDKVIEAAKDFKDIEPARVQEMIENGGLPRSIATKHPVVTYVSDRIGVADKAARRLIQENLTNLETGLLGKLRAVKEKGTLWAEMMRHEGQNELSSDTLRAKGFSDKEIALHEQYRQISTEFFNKFNEMRTAMGKKPISERVAHIAGRFMGDFYATAERVKLDANGNPKVLPDGSFEKEFIGRISANTRGELSKALDHMKAANSDWQFSGVKYKKSSGGSSAAARYAGFMEVVNQITKEDPNMGALVKAYENFLKEDAAKFLNAERTAKAKKSEAGGVVGSEGNKPWLDMQKNGEEGFKAQLSYFEQGYMWMERQKAQADIDKVLTAPEVIDMPNVQEWGTRYLDHVYGRNIGKFAEGMNAVADSIGELTGFGHTNMSKLSNSAKHLMMQMWMGFMNVRFSVTQLAQPFQSMPPLITLLKARGMEFSMAEAGVKSQLTMMKVGYENVRPGFFKEARLNPFEKQALQYAHDNSIFDVRMADHTKDINVSRGKEAFNEFADFNIKVPEMYTRGSAFMFYAHALKDAGVPIEHALPAAEKLTTVAMVDYTPQARPQMYEKAGNLLGDTASTLARYKHAQLQNTTMYTREARDFKHYGPMFTHYASMVAWGGLKGLIAFNTADELYKYISKKVGKPGSMADWLTSNTPRWVSHGVSGLTGVDMSGSFSNADIVPDNPMDFLVPYMGDLGRRAESAVDLAKHPNEFNFKKAVHANAPSSLKGLLEDKWFTADDGLVLNPRTKEGTYIRSPEERKMRQFGMRSVEEGAKSDHLYAQKYVRDEARKEYRASIVDKVISDLRGGQLSPNEWKKYAEDYARLGKSDNFMRDVLQSEKAAHLTAEQRYLMRNLSTNYTGANRLQEYFNKD